MLFLGLAVAIVIGLDVAGVEVIPIEQTRPEAQTHHSKNNLKQIGLALWNYHDEYEMFPPGKIVTEGGADIHDWSVLILPYLDRPELYEQIHLDQPVSSPENQSLFQSDSEELDIYEFRNPMNHEKNLPSHTLHYALNSRVFLPNRGMTFDEITDGTSQTFMGGEISEGLRPWFEPGHLRDPSMGFNKGPETFGSPWFGQRRYEGVHMLMMDGAVRMFSDDIDPAVLKALATPDAGDDTKGYP